MAYQFCDTFDYYDTTMLNAQVLWELSGGAGGTISSSYARYPQIGSYPNKGVYLPFNGYLRKNLQSNQGTLIPFISYGNVALPVSGQSAVLAFYDNGTLQSFLGVTATGALQFYNHSSVAIGPASTAGLISPSIIPNHGIELQVVFSNGSGSVECYLDGSLIIPLTSGLITIGSAHAYANQIQIGAGSGISTSGAAMYCDYVRVWDATGSYQNAPLGVDRRKLTKLPEGPGDLTQWTANGAATNWECTNNNPPDDDTTYVSSTASSTYDSYAMGSSGLITAPSMTVVKSFVRKDDSATRAIEIGVRSGGVNGLGSPITVGSSYTFVDTCISVDPATGLPPTAAAADAFQHLKNEST